MIWTLVFLILAGAPQARPSELAHTYSIVAYDAETGEAGAAVQSHWFSVGSIVIWARAGVGAVATQSFVNVDYGPRGIEGMAAGKAPGSLLSELVRQDEGREVRQVALVDARGRVAAHTGKNCIAHACDLQGEGFSVQANMMLEDTVCLAMSRAFTSAKGSLARRLMAALEAAEKEGGDIRGRQSAAMKVVSAERHEQPWEGVVVDIRVDDHESPLEELGRLLTVQEAYNYMNEGDLAIERQQMERALEMYRKAESMLPGRLEPRYWHAVQLVALERLEEALPMFREIFARDPNWLKLTRRLADAGLLPDDPEVLEAIEKQAR